MKTRFSHLKLASVTAAAAVTLAACAGGVTVSRENVDQGYEPDELYIVGTGENEIKTFIVGDPFGVPKEAFQAAVIASLEGRNFGPRLNLSIDPKIVDVRKRHVVLAFNPTNISQVDDLCAGSMDTAKASDTGDSLTVTAVYCSTDHYLTQATARSNGVTGTDTEQFRKLMTQLAIALFPDENPHRQLDGPDPLPPLIP
ncbi:MAG: hypothetical protein ACI8S3_001290 [Alphaproteobacteria bacterium]|jgi:hypothetical protein